MKSKTEQILTAMKVVSWLALIGFSLKAGSQLISFALVFTHPEDAKKIYDIDNRVFELRQYHNWYFICAMSITVALSILKALIWIPVIQLLSKLNLQAPFTADTSKRIEKIAHQLLGIGLIGIMGNAYFGWLTKHTGIELINTGAGNETLFVAGIAYIISQVFKRGIEIQEENQLTV